MKYDFIIFGGTGLQGRICAKDLLDSGCSVLLAGRDKSGIKEILGRQKTGFIEIDLRNQEEIVKAIKMSNPEVVINCAELDFNVSVMKACLETKKSCTDLGGLQKITEEQFKLDLKFKEKGILNLTGCGSTPGIINVMADYAVSKLDSVESISLGFAWNSNIKKFVVPYSIQSIFEEFTQSPVTFHRGKFVRESRMRCKETIDFKYVGRQTVYCIVHSEVYSFSKNFKDKGLKNIHYMAGFPEHSIKIIESLLDLGFNSREKIDIDGAKISPLDFTVQTLKKIKTPKGYSEVENLWLRIEGMKDRKKKKSELNCIIKSIKGWESAGSNVDTGRTISIISQMIKDGLIKEKGVKAPEKTVPWREFFKELAKREMWVYEDGRKIN